MKNFEDYFSDNEIIRHICKIRVKLAKSRSKKHLLHLLTNNEKFNYHKLKKESNNEFEKYQETLLNELSKILPARKRWIKLGEISRRKTNSKNQFLTSNDKNFYSILKTIKKYKKQGSTVEWLLNLQKFIDEIRTTALSNAYAVSTPIILPQLKDPGKKKDINECRPICLFGLKDRIILSATNKFLTQLFDNQFHDSSYAFRAKKNKEGKILSHHDCIKDILEYRIQHNEAELYVVECDIKKFYDTVNHKIVRELFYELKDCLKDDFLNIDLNFPIRIFESYLECFAFNINIPKPDELEYWDSYKIQNGEFSWVNNILFEHYESISEERIGVPQGGALSGLIANIYLNKADKVLQNSPVLYQRFCDDMIIIHPNKDECIKAKELYLGVLNELKLFPHPFKVDNELINIDEDQQFVNYKPFWSGKSKGPFKWSSLSEKGFPWIGFVGYEINHNGDLRVRKSSFEKEIAKQKKIIKEIEKAISIEMRKPKGTATESAINRLVGMSVGRIGLDNFEEVSADLCWKNGFKELTLNKHTLRQIKGLDRNRSKQYYKFLKNIKDPEIDPEKPQKREVIHYNKPFSYFYQILERDHKANA